MVSNQLELIPQMVWEFKFPAIRWPWLLRIFYSVFQEMVHESKCCWTSTGPPASHQGRWSSWCDWTTTDPPEHLREDAQALVIYPNSWRTHQSCKVKENKLDTAHSGSFMRSFYRQRWKPESASQKHMPLWVKNCVFSILNSFFHL